MNGRARNIGRVASTLWVAALFCISSLGYLPSEAHAQDQERTRSINGFDLSGRFLDVWSQPGSDRDSFYVNGLPITQRRPEISITDGKVYDTQWFERASYEYHPENQPPYDVMLGLLGSSLAQGRGAVDPATRQLRDSADAGFVGLNQPGESSGRVWFPETQHALSGKFLDTWNHYGGLQQFGFPISEPFEEQSPTDSKLYTVQYFERNRFELHPDKPPPYDVELGLLGVQQYRLQAVAADALPISPPKGVTSTKDTYTEGSLQEPDTLFCNEANTAVALRFCSAITFNDSLVGMDDKGDYFPLAAWYVPTFENGGSYFVGTGDDRHLITKYKLRPGIKWSDGTELTSADAIFSYKLKLEDPYTTNPILTKKLASLDNPDKYTIVYRWMSVNQAKALLANPKTDKAEYAFLTTFIDLKRPVVDPAYVEVGTVHPEHALASIPFDKIGESSKRMMPTGYGPYVVQNWEMSDHMTLVRDENYNLTAKPLIGTIVTKFSTDVVAQINSFLGNRSTYLPNFPTIDGIARDGFMIPFEPEWTANIKAAGGVISAIPSASWEHLGFRMDWQPFTDLRVRQAIAYGINRQNIIDIVYRGAGEVLDTPVPPQIYHSLDNPDYSENFPDLAAKYKLPHYEYDPVKANALLDAAGWIKGPNGIRAKGGQKLQFEYGTSRNATRQAIQALVARDIYALGVDAVVVPYPSGYFNPDGPLYTGRCKLCQFAYTTTATSNFDAWEHSELNTESCCPGVNWQHYNNRKVNAANHLFKTSVDRHEIAEQSAIIQEQIMTDGAIIPLVQTANIEIYSGKMRGRKPTNSTVPDWWNLAQWYFVP